MDLQSQSWNVAVSIHYHLSTLWLGGSLFGSTCGLTRSVLAQDAVLHFLLRSRPSPIYMNTYFIYGVGKPCMARINTPQAYRRKKVLYLRTPAFIRYMISMKDELEYSYLRNRNHFGDGAMRIRECNINGIRRS